MGGTRSSECQTQADFGGRPVYVIDDDADLRDSLKFLLSTRNASVLAFTGAQDFLDIVAGLNPAPLIIDVRMPVMDGLQLLEELANRRIHWPSVFLSGHGEIAVAVRALKLGAADFLEKPVAAAELEECLTKQFLTIDRIEMSSSSRESAIYRLSSLTARETEVLTSLCQGLINKQVAHLLGLSPRTVEMHRSNALKRLNVRSLTEVLKLKVIAGQM